jgi:hypothetical protein
LAQAYTVVFYSQDKADVDNNNIDLNATTPHFEAITNGVYNLATLISKAGPANKDMSMPIKPSTVREVYNFTGIWVDYLDNNRTEYYVDSYFEDVSSEWDSEKRSRLFSQFKPDKNMRLVPIFEALTRTYAIRFYNEA